MSSTAERDFLASNVMFEMLTATRAMADKYEENLSKYGTDDGYWQKRLADARRAYQDGMKAYSSARVAKIFDGEKCENPGECL